MSLILFVYIIFFYYRAKTTGVLFCVCFNITNRGSREDMGAIASPVDNVPQPMGGHHTTLMEDPDVWRPT